MESTAVNPMLDARQLSGRFSIVDSDHKEVDFAVKSASTVTPWAEEDTTFESTIFKVGEGGNLVY